LNALHDHTIIISPVGSFAPDLLAAIGPAIHRTYRINARVIRLLHDIEFAFDPKRAQYGSTPVLTKLSTAAPPWALKVLALVREDLFVPIFTHVFGEAQIGGKAAIVSTARLYDKLTLPLHQGTFIQRTIKEILHELGHTFNLRHCRDHRCIMHYSNSVADVDRRSDALCRYCEILLADEIQVLKKSLVSRSHSTWGR
jgi:archaemetzincin